MDEFQYEVKIKPHREAGTRASGGRRVRQPVSQAVSYPVRPSVRQSKRTSARLDLCATRGEASRDVSA